MVRRRVTVVLRAMASAAAAAVMVGGVSMSAGAQGGDPLSSYLWQKRILLVFAPGASDPQLREQRRIVAAADGAARDRDLVVIEVTGTGPGDVDLRRRFAPGAGGFRAVLIGKDGGAKLSSDTPLAAERWIETIDAMPMRRQEQRRQGS
ncbi:DUF4174 domain-containing protein [Microvirga pudoricolor]|uniref:DUF4174 domain-containing protein n=1 Tax=Microvirga pudoricolor TaxID=2778729 RepID=UPI0019519ED9|nr:DUF4174 domain-containing protein [Microvirga pudoricolor]MBM6595986.1 DUF4174 domain-containing protein [Microvirga pudoricolor]